MQVKQKNKKDMMLKNSMYCEIYTSDLFRKSDIFKSTKMTI